MLISKQLPSISAKIILKVMFLITELSYFFWGLLLHMNPHVALIKVLWDFVCLYKSVLENLPQILTYIDDRQS